MQQCTIIEVPTIVTKPVEPDTDIILEHPLRHEPHNDRFALWYAPATGILITPDGEQRTIGKLSSIQPLLDFILKYTVDIYRGGEKSVNLFILAGRDNKDRPKREWFTVTHDWRSNLDKYGWKNLTFRYWHNSFTIQLIGTGSYFGAELKDINGIRHSWHDLETILEDKFGGDHLLGNTPAGTGRELLLHALPKDIGYPLIAEDLRELIYHNIPQGRVEVFPPQVEVVNGTVYVIDGKWFYVSCLSHPPVGPVYHDTVNEFVGYRRKDNGKLSIDYVPGFYYVTTMVPKGWQHIGLLKEENGGYPREPGYTFSNWVTSAELSLALDQEWNIHIHERIFWPDTKIADPLAKWRKLLVDLRTDSTDKYHQSAIRNILLHIIGSFHAIGTSDDCFMTEDDPRLETIKPYKGRVDPVRGGYRWQEFKPYRRESRKSFVHPEWAATVWGRARARLATFALQLPYESIIAVCNDAIYSTVSSGIDDTKVPGIFRDKERIPGPFTWPKNYAFLYGFQKQHNLQLHEYQDKEIEL